MTFFFGGRDRRICLLKESFHQSANQSEHGGFHNPLLKILNPYAV